jgi:hypothetical protein
METPSAGERDDVVYLGSILGPFHVSNLSYSFVVVY